MVLGRGCLCGSGSHGGGCDDDDDVMCYEYDGFCGGLLPRLTVLGVPD